MTDLIHIMYMDMSLLEERKTNDIVAKILFLVPHLILCRSDIFHENMVATTFGHHVQAACLKAYSHGHMYASANVLMSHIPDDQAKSIAKIHKWLTKQSDCYDVSESGKKYKLAKGTSGDVRKRLIAMGLLDAETSKPVAKKTKSRTQSPKKTIAKAKKPKAKKSKSKKAEEAEGEEAEGEEAEGEEAEGEEAEGEEAKGKEAEGKEAEAEGEEAEGPNVEEGDVEEASKDAAEEAGEDAADDQAEEVQGEAEKPDDN